MTSPTETTTPLTTPASESPAPRDGGCACGAVRFRISAPLMGVGVCHCRDCQRASGGAPNYVALVPNAGFELVRGAPRIHTVPADRGAPAARAFCPNCGTPLWSTPAHAPFTAVKLGALDDSTDLRPGLHLYVASAAPWHKMHEGLPQFPGMPPAAGA
jgi:hypothetical protein